MSNPVISLKIIVVGKPFTGKTSFVKKWIGGHFSTSYKATIVSDFSSKLIKLNDIIYTIQLWDLGGQDRNNLLTKMFCKDSHGAIVLCEAEDDESLQSTKEWIKLVHENITFMNDQKLPILLIQNKSDLIVNLKENEAKMKAFCEENSIENYFFASAKTGHNVNEAMNHLLTEITDKLGVIVQSKRNNNNITLIDNVSEDNEEKKKRKCC